MKTLFVTSRIIPGTGRTDVQLIGVNSPANEFQSTAPLFVRVFGETDFFKPNTTYELSISEHAPEAAPAEQLTETNNLNPNQMSIFSKISEFFANLFDSTKKEYEKLDPVIKADVRAAITVVNVIKTNLDKPASETLTLIENELGSFATDKVKNVIADVATDLGIAAKVVDATSPVSVLEAIVAALTAASGNNLLDMLLNFAKYIVVHLNPGDIDRENGGSLVQWVKSHLTEAEPA